MVQDLIPGGDDELYTLGAYLSESLEPLGLFCGRKLIQTPPGIGTARLAEAVWVDEVVDAGLHLLRALGCNGLSQVEFKRDPRDGKFKLMEVNPRLWQWHSLARASGVDLPLIAYRDLTGEPVEAVRMNGGRRKWAILLMPGERPVVPRPPFVEATLVVAMTPSPRSCTRCARSAARGEGPARHDVLAARGRRGRAAAAEVRDAPAGARDRDARARARRPEVDPPRRRARLADAGVGAPRALRRAEGPEARRGAARRGCARARGEDGAAHVSPRARPRRERDVERDRDPRRGSRRARRGDRRRRHDLAAELRAPDRRRGEATDRRQVGRRRSRLDGAERRPSRRDARGTREGADAGDGRASDRALRRRVDRRLRLHRRGAPLARRARARSA